MSTTASGLDYRTSGRSLTRFVDRWIFVLIYLLWNTAWWQATAPRLVGL